MQDFRRNDRARRPAARPLAGTAVCALLALAGPAALAPAALAQMVVTEPGVQVDLGVLDQLGPAETLPGLLYAPAAPRGFATGGQGAPGMMLLPEPDRAPRSRLHVGVPTAPAKAAPRPTAKAEAPRPAKPAAPVKAAARPTPPPPPMPPAPPAPAVVATPAAAPALPESKPAAVPVVPITALPPAPAPEPAAVPAPPPVAAPAPAPAPVVTASAKSIQAVSPAMETPAPRAATPEPEQPEPERPEPARPQPVEAATQPPPADETAPAVAALPRVTADSVSLPFSGEETALTGDASAELERLAAALADDADAQAQILAYATAGDGNASRARRVSLARALAVRSFLMERGVASTRIEVRALGNQVPDGAPDRVDVRLVTP